MPQTSLVASITRRTVCNAPLAYHTPRDGKKLNHDLMTSIMEEQSGESAEMLAKWTSIQVQSMSNCPHAWQHVVPCTSVHVYTERNFLIDLISERIDIIILKQTDHGSREKKEVAQQEISGLFDAKFGNKWSLTQKQDLWKRLRITAKKELSAYNWAVRTTGGGPPSMKSMFPF